MLIELAHVLPVPGPLWGQRPMRADDDRAPPWRRPRAGSALFRCRSLARHAQQQADAWRAASAQERSHAIATVRLRLRRDGLTPAATACALGIAAACAADTLGWQPRATQLIGAAALLDNRMAEMATGEGKTLAVGLAAAVAALAGVPVHVVTANDYLAARDATRLAPLFRALGVTVTALSSGQGDSERRAAYAHDVVYATAKDLAFDFLRDQQTLDGRRECQQIAAELTGAHAAKPLMRGLCMALLDEADSILLDEADVPLILSRAAAHAARRAFLWQALQIARVLVQRVDFTVQREDRAATLTAAGAERLTSLAAPLGGPWRRPRYAREAVVLALCALHVYRRDEHYLVKDGAIELLDEVTGRMAVGRVWSRGLHVLVALKENLRPAAENETIAQTTFQRFFQRYWRLCGISGTLWEARAELRAVYGASVVRVPLDQPSRRVALPPRCCAAAAARFDAVVERVALLRSLGRPVLIGTDSVGDSQQLSALLQRRGIDHTVLNALHHADEAAIVAAAGRSGQVTVATRMAGRGTDIELDPVARAAGGLHVLSCQNNASRRHDRQFAGRAGRHGDPGSSEVWFLAARIPSVPSSAADMGSPWNPSNTLGTRLQWLLRCWMQRREERRRALLRDQLLKHDLDWERRLAFAGRAA